MATNFDEEPSLILAAEDCGPEEFARLHRFSKSDDRLVAKLIAHGPVLLRGSRGSGKSALMIEASHRLDQAGPDAPAFGVYISLRRLALLRSDADAYVRLLCDLITEEIQEKLSGDAYVFDSEPTIASVQGALGRLSKHIGKRIVLFFDDAAHIGRETSLAPFFDNFRTLSSRTVSCKAAIYPGVTRFGNRFDVFNDATVMEVSRSEELPGFQELFSDIMEARYASQLPDSAFSNFLPRERVAAFLGQSVLGNMRAFVRACNELAGRAVGTHVGFSQLSDTLLTLASDHYWPLLEELKPKLGVYGPMVEPARGIAEIMFESCGKARGCPYALVHRDTTERLAKPFEMLEYVGFVARRQVSRAMKSGGRGARFAVNLCNLLEITPGTRLTRDLFERWCKERPDPVEFHRGSPLKELALPELSDSAELEILGEPVRTLAKSNAYPYGLTEAKILVLEEAEVKTVKDLAEAPDEFLQSLSYVGPASIRRFRNVVGQAIWM